MGLIGMLACAGGCGQDNATMPTATEEQKDRMNKFTDSMKGARAEAGAEGRKSAGGRNVQKRP